MSIQLVPERPQPPPALPGFEHIRRYWMREHGSWAARILPGEYYVTSKGEAISTVLGSCVACVLYDPLLRIGGMNHFMLPEDAGRSSWNGIVSESTRYGSYAMEMLINAILRAGGSRTRLEAKLFGGGQIMNTVSAIGESNALFAREYLNTEGIPILADDTGGRTGRNVIFLSSTSKVLVRKLNEIQTTVRAEEKYRSSIAQKPISGDIELFD